MSLKSPPSGSVTPTSASKPKPGKKKTKQEEEEERLAKEAADAAAALAAIPPSPFDRIDEVWALDGQFAEQRKLVGQIFEVEDGPGICIQSLTLDDIYAHIHFGRSIGLNNEQLKIFFGIMQDLKARLCEPDITTETAFTSFKAAVMANSAVVRGNGPPPPPILTSPKDAAVLIPNLPTTTTRRPTSSKGERPNSRGKDGSSSTSASNANTARKDSSKSGAPTPRASPSTEDTTPPTQPPPPALPKTFSIPLIKEIVSYASRTVFQHFQLYRAVFNPKHFRPRKNLLIERLLIETVVPERIELDTGIDLSAEERKLKAAADYQLQSRSAESKQSADIWTASDDGATGAIRTQPTSPTQVEEDELPTDEISILVRQHMAKAREQLQQLLVENEKQFDAKLKSLEAKLHPPPPASKTSISNKKK